MVQPNMIVPAMAVRALEQARAVLEAEREQRRQDSADTLCALREGLRVATMPERKP